MDGKLNDVLADLVTKLGDAAQARGPKAIELVGRYVQATSIGRLIVGVGCLGASAAFLYVTVRLARLVSDENDAASLYLIGSIATGIVGIVFTVAGLTDLLEVSNWLAALDPQMALVKAAMTAGGK